MSHLHDYVCLYSQHDFQCMLSLFRLIDTHVLTWFQILCWFMIFILKFTGHCLYLFSWITSLNHVYVWLPEHANWLYLTYRWVIFWQSWTFIFRSKSLNHGVLVVADQSAQWKRGLAVVCPKPLFFQPLLIGLRDSHLTTREYFSVFLYCILCFFAS